MYRINDTSKLEIWTGLKFSKLEPTFIPPLVPVVPPKEWIIEGSNILQSPTPPNAADYRIVGTTVEAEAASVVTFAVAPLLVGAATTNSTLTVSGIAIGGTAYEYRWTANGVVIPGATTSTYVTPSVIVSNQTYVAQIRALSARGVWSDWASSNSIIVTSESLAIFTSGPTLITLLDTWDVVFSSGFLTINAMPEVPILAATFGSAQITVTG